MTGRGGTPGAVLVTVGDEILLGRTVDTNASWLADRLSGLGLRVLRTFTVGDDDGEIRRAVRRGIEDAELVVVTGGLGPTSDDRTRGAVARLLDAPLRVDEDRLARLEERFRRAGYERLPERNVSQAEIPEGARVLENPHGTAPGLALETGDAGALVTLLPGVPREMKSIFDDALKDLLRERFGERLRPVHQRTLHTTGIAESELAARVDRGLPDELGPVSVAFLPDVTGVDLRLTARDVTAEEAARWFDRVEEALAPVLRGFRYDSPGGDLAEAVADLLAGSARRLGVAESCTGGLVAKRLTDVAGASAWFVGGVVAYSDDVKVDALGVERELIRRVGAVSEEVAVAMARGAVRALDADVSVSVTGIAGPSGGSEEKPVGTVWIASSVDGGTSARRHVFPGDRESVRERAAQAALAQLLERLRP